MSTNKEEKTNIPTEKKITEIKSQQITEWTI